jgi:hypothetical protein
MKRSYAVVWSRGQEQGSGRLEPHDDRFELHGRDAGFSILFSDLAGASIARGHADRLRGLAVLLLRRHDSAPVRIASLDGPGVLHELAEHVERAGLAVAA